MLKKVVLILNKFWNAISIFGTKSRAKGTTSLYSTELLLDKKVSYQENAWGKLGAEYSIKWVLLLIKNGGFKKHVEPLRVFLERGEKEKYNAGKQRLPAVTFCATFNTKRSRATIKNYNEIVILDVDKLSNEELIRCKSCFKSDIYVFAYWESPSQKGLKGLVWVSFLFQFTKDNIDHRHKSAFVALKAYFEEEYDIELDKSGSDTTRLCFVSDDPELVLKKQTTPFLISNLIENPKKLSTRKKSNRQRGLYINDRDALFNPKGKNSPSNRYIMYVIIKFLEKRNLSITKSYDDWFKVASAIAASFTYDIGEGYFLRLSELDKEKFNKADSQQFLINRYQDPNNRITFSSILYLAGTHGYKTKAQLKRGSEAAAES